MNDKSILYRIRAALQGGYVAVANEIETLASYTGVLSGINDTETALSRIDGTGIGSPIFTFNGPYIAQGSNINEWFGNRQQTRLRCVSNGGVSPVTFTLPGAGALATAFDALVTAGLPETIRFVIEYTGASSTFLRVIPRTGTGNPVIGGTSAIIIRSNISATVEITRSNGTIGNYVFQSIGGIGDTGGGTLDSIKLINPSQQVWDASSNGTLPTTSVVKGNAYRVANAPSDGSGRFDEVMQNGDWVVWEGETFTSWEAEPHLWFVLPAHDVRRISALEDNFLSTFIETPQNSRNTVIQGADYADSVGEIRLKLYAQRADYEADDLNTTGDVDAFTDTTTQTSYLGVRLPDTNVNLTKALTELYVYVEDASGNFTRLGNLANDFTFEGDFGQESDYLSIEPIDYTSSTTLRLYIGEAEPRYNSEDLDVLRNNLSDEVQGQLDFREPWAGVAEVLFSGATVRDIHEADRVEYQSNYSRGVDWRDMAESISTNDNRYIDNELSISVNLSAFTINGFGPNLQKLVSIGLQRNDANSGVGAMVELAPSVAFIRVNTANEVQVNTTPGSTATWSTLSTGGGSVTLGAGDNSLIFELVLRNPADVTAGYELLAVLHDGTNYHEFNNVDITIPSSITGDNLGFSRSSNQRGQVTRFSAINSQGYLTHSQLDSLLRQHYLDKWNFGYARLYGGATRKEVDFQTAIEDKSKLIVNGVPRYDSLAAGVSSMPTSDTEESITLFPSWVGNRAIKLVINGVSISGFDTRATTVVGGRVNLINYTITSAQWAQVYSSSSTQLDYSFTDDLNNSIYQNTART